MEQNNGFMIFGEKNTLTYFCTLNKKLNWYIYIQGFRVQDIYIATNWKIKYEKHVLLK